MDFKLGDLIQTTIRNGISTDGIRKIANNAINNTNNGGGLLGFLTSAAGWLIGGLWNAISHLIDWSLTGLFNLLVQAAFYIWNFNFNMSNSQPEEDLKGLLNTSASLLGFTVGQAMGYLTCGVVPGLALFAFNEPLGVHVLNEFGEHALQQLAASGAACIQSTFQQATPVIFEYLYVGARKALLPQLVSSGIVSQSDADKINQGKAKPWSFASATEELIHEIPDKTLQAFIESVYQSFGQACIEAGFVVINSIESYTAHQKHSAAAIVGNTNTVQVFFNRQNSPNPNGGYSAGTTNTGGSAT